MPKKKYTLTFKAKIIISILQVEKEFNEICTENNLNLNMVRKWKQYSITITKDTKIV